MDTLPRLPRLWLSSSGGLVYHLRAWRAQRQWAAFHAQIAAWLADWQPARRQLVLIGPSAGYALPVGFLARFETVLALEPDPWARRMLRRRPDGAHLRFSDANVLATPEGLARLAASIPDAAVLFCNVLGQLDAPGGDWAGLLARHLAAQPWASYHDAISTRLPPTRIHSLATGSGRPMEKVLAHFWDQHLIEVVDHATWQLAGPQGEDYAYALWPPRPGHWHLVEWCSHRPPGLPAAEPSARASAYSPR